MNKIPNGTGHGRSIVGDGFNTGRVALDVKPLLNCHSTTLPWTVDSLAVVILQCHRCLKLNT